MRKVLLAIAVLTIPMSALAQTEDCPGCMMGLFDSSEMIQNFGTWDPTGGQVLKTIWIGIRFDPNRLGEISGLNGVEVSVDGIPIDPVFGAPQVTPTPPATIELGDTILTPDDEENGTGGKNYAWAPTCLEGNRAIVKIDMLSTTAVGENIVMRVRRKFPPSVQGAPTAVFTQCNSPINTSTFVTEGCYVLNPTVGPGEMVDGCLLETVAVSKNTWSHVKALFK